MISTSHTTLFGERAFSSNPMGVAPEHYPGATPPVPQILSTKREVLLAHPLFGPLRDPC